MPKQKTNNKGLIALIICLPIVLIMGIYSYAYSHNKTMKTIAYINEESITEDEFNLFFARERAGVFSYFHSKYTVNDEDDFWHTSYNGKTPIMVARQRTLEILKSVKVEQQLMKQEGIMEDASYRAFLRDLEKENKRRVDALENKQVIYGPKQFKENTYYDYLHSNRRIKLKEILSKTKFEISNDMLEKYYIQSKDDYPDYKKQDYIKTQVIKITYTKEGKSIMPEEDAKKQINKAMDELQSNSFVTVMAKYNEGQQAIDRIFDDTTARQNIKYESELYTPVSMLKVNDITDPIQFNGAYYIVKCVAKMDGGYHLYESYRDIIHDRYIDKVYEDYLQDLIEHATVDIVQKVYQRFDPQ